mmetsp:Transcript_19554/g.62699  ORF Transcript_19554/g.62699 Transcript_19554/m.62699 type:complete len:241 (-) Transcript_19554:563-1285(-)
MLVPEADARPRRRVGRQEWAALLPLGEVLVDQQRLEERDARLRVAQRRHLAARVDLALVPRPLLLAAAQVDGAARVRRAELFKHDPAPLREGTHVQRVKVEHVCALLGEDVLADRRRHAVVAVARHDHVGGGEGGGLRVCRRGADPHYPEHAEVVLGVANRERVFRRHAQRGEQLEHSAALVDARREHLAPPVSVVQYRRAEPLEPRAKLADGRIHARPPVLAGQRPDHKLEHSSRLEPV